MTIIRWGERGRASDSLAATDIATAVLKHSEGKVKLTALLASELSGYPNMLLLGHPCQNDAIPLSCKTWPYRPGQAVIQVDGNNLIVAGTLPEDTRFAAKVLADYTAHPELKDQSRMILTRELGPFETEQEIPSAPPSDGLPAQEEQDAPLPELTPSPVQEEASPPRLPSPPESRSFLARLLRWFLAVFRR